MTKSIIVCVTVLLLLFQYNIVLGEDPFDAYSDIEPRKDISEQTEATSVEPKATVEAGTSEDEALDVATDEAIEEEPIEAEAEEDEIEPEPTIEAIAEEAAGQDSEEVEEEVEESTSESTAAENKIDPATKATSEEEIAEDSEMVVAAKPAETNKRERAKTKYTLRAGLVLPEDSFHRDFYKTFLNAGIDVDLQLYKENISLMFSADMMAGYGEPDLEIRTGQLAYLKTGDSYLLGIPVSLTSKFQFFNSRKISPYLGFGISFAYYHEYFVWANGDQKETYNSFGQLLMAGVSLKLPSSTGKKQRWLDLRLKYVNHDKVSHGLGFNIDPSAWYFTSGLTF